MKRRLDILAAGMDKITRKSGYIYNAFEKRGLKCLIYSSDKTGLLSHFNPGIKSEVIRIPRCIVHDIVRYHILLFTRKPNHVELYSTRILSQFFYTVGCFILGISLSVVCIGSELYLWDEHKSIRRLVDRLMFRVSRLVIITELYMKDTIRQHHICDDSKLFFFHNRIPVNKDFTALRDGKNVLFLNTFKPWRKLEIIIEAASMVVKEIPHARFHLVGSTLGINYLRKQHGYEKQLLKRIQELGIEEHVEVVPFTAEPEAYYEMASVFVLPADLVFCNFSLLEAMERCVPPVVARVRGSERMIDQAVDGYLVDQTSQDFAECIIGLLRDAEKRCRMGIRAREKVLRDFDLAKGISSLIQAYSERLSKR